MRLLASTQIKSVGVHLNTHRDLFHSSTEQTFSITNKYSSGRHLWV